MDQETFNKLVAHLSKDPDVIYAAECIKQHNSSTKYEAGEAEESLARDIAWAVDECLGVVVYLPVTPTKEN